MSNLTLTEIGNFLSKLAEKSQHVYWLSSPDFKKIIYISPAYEEIWGRPREALYKNPETWIEYIYPADLHDYHPIHAMADRIKKQEGEARYDEFYRIVRPDGELRWISDHGFPIYINHECCGVTGVAVDMTKEKLLEQEREHAKQQQELAEQTRMDFIHNIQHDIRTPFSGILGMANILSERETCPEKKELLNEIANCANELLDYCNSILDFSKVELGEHPIVVKKFNLKELIQKLYTIETPPAKAKNLKLEADYDDNLPDIVIGDQNRLYRILINLVSNAIKFTSIGYVKINAELAKMTNNQNAIIKFTIEDTGIGIPDDKQDVIYHKFTRLNPSSKGIYKGIGLGLRLVKQYLDEMDGQIELDSKVNHGTKIICLIPFKIPLV